MIGSKKPEQVRVPSVPLLANVDAQCATATKPTREVRA